MVIRFKKKGIRALGLEDKNDKKDKILFLNKTLIMLIIMDLYSRCSQVLGFRRVGPGLGLAACVNKSWSFALKKGIRALGFEDKKDKKDKLFYF